MDKIVSYLRQVGLTETEQRLYRQGLERHEITVKHLVEQTGFNRTTVYHALSTLTEKGLARESKVDGLLRYAMTPPREIAALLSREQSRLEKQKYELEELLPLFPSAISSDKEHIEVEKLSGIEGVQRAVDRALYAKVRKWRIIAPKHNIFSQLSKEYATYFMQTRRERKIQAKSLWEKTEAGQKAVLSLEQLLMRRPRYLPMSMSGRFNATIIQFDTTLLFIHSIDNPTAVVITSQEFCETFNVLFDGLWETSTE